MPRSRPPKSVREANRAWDERWEDWNSWQNPGSADTSTDTATSPLQSEIIPRRALLLGTLPRSHDMNMRPMNAQTIHQAQHNHGHPLLHQCDRRDWHGAGEGDRAELRAPKSYDHASPWDENWSEVHIVHNYYNGIHPLLRCGACPKIYVKPGQSQD